MANPSYSQKYDGWTDCKTANFYAQSRPRYEKVAIPWLLEYYHRRHPSGGSRISLAIDVACGPGQLTGQLAESCDRVIGVDISPAMLEAARQHNARPNVEYRLGSAQELTEVCAGERADIVTVGLAINFFDNDEFYSQVREILKPGGVFAVLGYKTPGLEIEGLGTLVSDFMMDLFHDEPYRTHAISMLQSYGDVCVPFEDVERRSSRILVPTDQEGVRARLMSFSPNVTDQLERIERTMRRVPEGSFEMTCDVFGIFAHV